MLKKCISFRCSFLHIKSMFMCLVKFSGPERIFNKKTQVLENSARD